MDNASFLMGLIFGALCAVIIAMATFAGGFKEGAVAAYKQEVVCEYVPQLDKPSEWQCKEVR